MGRGEASERWTDAQRRSRPEGDTGEQVSAVTGATGSNGATESCKAGIGLKTLTECHGHPGEGEMGEKDTEEGGEPGSVAPWKSEA